LDEDTLDSAIVISQALGPGEKDEALPAVQGLIGALTNYLMSTSSPEEELRAALAQLQKAAESALETAIRMREDRADVLLPKSAQTASLAQLKDLAEAVLKDTRPLLNTKTLASEGSKYSGSTEPRTLAALNAGTARHLMITPKPGSREAKGAGELYPKDTTPEQQMQLALPTKKGRQVPFKALTVGGPVPEVLDVLALGGGHGGVNATFEEANEYTQGAGGREVVTYTGKPFEKKYWIDNVVKPMVDRGIKAKLIVLDACLTASMIDVFAPLCAPGGKIMASMYSINAKVMTPEVWSKVVSAQGSSGVNAVTESAQQVNEGATAHAIGTLFGLIKTGPRPEVEDLVAREPGIAPLVSRIRYIPRIVSSIAAFMRAKADARRQELLTDLRDLRSASPACDTDDANLADLVADFLETAASDQDSAEFCYDQARQAVVARLRSLTKVDNEEVSELLALLDTSSRSEVAKTGAGEIPAQVAVYDHDMKEIRFDKMFSEKAPRKRIEDSTGAESAKEMRQVEAELQKIAMKLGATLKAMPAKQVVRGHEGPSITLISPEGKESQLL
jgi:hypothetical protein